MPPRFLYLLLTSLLLNASVACSQNPSQSQTLKAMQNLHPLPQTEEEWRQRLKPEQFWVLRQKGTERPFSGRFYKHKEKGTYCCAGCGNPLFHSETKYDSGCGWPSFYEAIPGAVVFQDDYSHNMHRIEVLCARCNGHLGHIFDDGPKPTGKRFCINSLAMDFQKAEP